MGAGRITCRATGMAAVGGITEIGRWFLGSRVEGSGDICTGMYGYVDVLYGRVQICLVYLPR